MLFRHNVIQLAKLLSGPGLGLEVAGCEAVYCENDGNLQLVVCINLKFALLQNNYNWTENNLDVDLV